MKNTATPGNGSGGLTAEAAREAWSAALVRFDRDLQRRGAAERTRRAYGADVGELATWAAAQGLDPAALTYRTLRALRRPALGPQRRPAHAGPQARLRARVLPLDGRTR